MKRDMELVRRILLFVEAEEYDTHAWFVMPGEDPALVNRHVALMEQEALIDANVLDAGGVIASTRVFGLTWAGHDFLESIRNDTVWRQTMGFVKDKGGAVTMSVLKAIATKFAANHLGLPD